MRAVILATGGDPKLAQSRERWFAPLVTVLDRPFIQHVVEYVVGQGVSRIDMVLCHRADLVEDQLGDGTRWGCSCHYHLARSPELPCVRFRSLAFDSPDEWVLLADGERLPQIAIDRVHREDTRCVPFLCAEDAGGCAELPAEAWTGWAWIRAAELQSIPPETEATELGACLLDLADTDGGPACVERCLAVGTFSSYLSSVEAILAKRFQGLLHGGHEVEAGIWLSRNVSLHPTARVQPPVYIGSDCRIDRGASLGPLASIGERCVVANHSIIHHSVVLPASYVGEGLELDGCIVDRNRLINASVGVDVAVEDFLLGSLAKDNVRTVSARVAARLAAAVLFVLMCPLTLLLLLTLRIWRRGPVIYRKRVLRLPAPAEPERWQEFDCVSLCAFEPRAADSAGDRSGHPFAQFLLRLLPGLWHIARGEMSFVGVPLRSAEEARALPRDWQELVLQSKAGLVTESGVVYGEAANDDELYSAESMYAVAAGSRHDLHLLLRYAARLLFGGNGAALAGIGAESDDQGG